MHGLLVFMRVPVSGVKVGARVVSRDGSLSSSCVDLKLGFRVVAIMGVGASKLIANACMHAGRHAFLCCKISTI